MRSAAILIPFVLLSAPAFSQTPQENWSSALEMETVTVSAAARTPPIWRVTRGASQVWILGTVGPLPKTLEWNQGSLKPFVAGARQLLLPPGADVGLVDIGWFYVRHGDLLRQPRGQTLQSTLPQDLRTRFAAASALAKQDDGRYATDVPLVAAIRLQRDFREARDLQGGEPRRTVEKLARAERARFVRLDDFEVMPAVRDVLALPQAAQRGCLDQAVADTDRQAAHAAPAAEAWADGDVGRIKAHYAESRLIECVLGASQKAADINARVTRMMVSAIEDALRQPGKSVMLMGIGPLLRKGGVLEKLAASGAAIEGPPG